MVELLSTYTTENASQAREEAQRCIVASLADPNTFLLDHLLTLQPVKGEIIANNLSFKPFFFNCLLYSSRGGLTARLVDHFRDGETLSLH